MNTDRPAKCMLLAKFSGKYSKTW